MTTAAPDTRPHTSGRTMQRVGDLSVGLLVSLCLAGATSRLLTPPATYLWASGALYLAMAAVLWVKLPAGAAGPGIGAANRVTLGRAALAVPFIALCLPPITLGVAGSWWVIGVSTLVMVLDGVDGRVARRTGTESAFGARFDMELDAALILALSVLVWTEGRAGAWCLLIGLMRYGFVVAGAVWPVLRAPLPESLRRKAVCVVQGVVLLVALGPIIPAGMATLVVAAGLLALIYSFAVDVRWALANQAGAGGL